MAIEVTPSGAACGAHVRGVDLSGALTPEAVAAIRAAWLQHHVLCFPDQDMSDDDLERFTLYFGPFGDDPYLAPIQGRKNIAAIQRRADETAPIFAGSWHTDWSFQKIPPAGTCLYGIEIPPAGGDTLFANQHLALDEMPQDFRARVDGLTAIHSAHVAYSPDGIYKTALKDSSMDIIYSDDANASQTHPFVRPHPETQRLALYGTFGYITGFVDMPKEEGDALLAELYEYQGQDRFVYAHKWQPQSLVMWDNRSVLHSASGGFEGHARLLHRTTIGERV